MQSYISPVLAVLRLQSEEVRDIFPRIFPFGVFMAENIGIIAGGGQFPRLVAQDARGAGLGVFICGFQGHTDPATAEYADEFELLHLGQLNRMVEFFKRHGVTRVCMAGAISKPKALDFRPDWRAARLLFSLKKRRRFSAARHYGRY